MLNEYRHQIPLLSRRDMLAIAYTALVVTLVFAATAVIAVLAERAMSTCPAPSDPTADLAVSVP